MRNVLVEMGIALGLALICTAIAAHALGYGPVPLGVPSTYDGDGLYYAALIKGTLENGWFLDNPDLGAPFGLDMRPFPMVDNTHFFMLKLIGYVAGDFASTMTIFYLFSFFAVAVVAYAAMRWMGIGRMLSACGAFLYSLQSYHFIRGSHLMLASYFVVPVLVGFAFSLYGRAAWLGQRWWGTLCLFALLFVAAGCGVYYDVFCCLLIGFASISAAIEKLSWRPLVLGLVAGLAMLVGIATNLAPSLIESRHHVSDIKIVDRHPREAELFGLRLTQLALPWVGHRNSSMHGIAASYGEEFSNVNENSTASIGMLALSGFLGSIAALLLGSLWSGLRPLVRMGAMNVLAFAYATIGGIGAWLAWEITPEIRALNRISIVIAFVSLCALVWILQSLCDRLEKSAVRTAAMTIGVGFIALVGFWDQVPAAHASAAHRNQSSYLNDAASGEAIMRALQPGSAVYQLPYVPYPEGPAYFREDGYGLLRRYLHTHDIRWSFAAMKGREGDQWIRAIERLPLENRLSKLRASGFSAVMVERKAFDDNGRQLESQLSATLGPPTMVCPDQSCALYDLESGFLEPDTALLTVARGPGFKSWAEDPTAGTVSATGSGNSAKLYLLNPLRRPISARIRATLERASATSISATLDEKAVISRPAAVDGSLDFDLTVDLAPGIRPFEIRVSPQREAENSGATGPVEFQLRRFSIAPANSPSSAIRAQSRARADKIFSEPDSPGHPAH